MTELTTQEPRKRRKGTQSKKTKKGGYNKDKSRNQ